MALASGQNRERYQGHLTSAFGSDRVTCKANLTGDREYAHCILDRASRPHVPFRPPVWVVRLFRPSLAAAVADCVSRFSDLADCVAVHRRLAQLDRDGVSLAFAAGIA